MDRLTTLLTNFSLHAGVFYTGNICGIHDFQQDEEHGHLHLIKRGSIRITGLQKEAVHIDEPTLLFLPRTNMHRMVANENTGADVVCGTIQFGGGGHNPISDSLPDIVIVKLSEIPSLNTVLNALFEEVFSDHCGRQGILDRLSEVIIIQLLRYCLDHNLTKGGALAGLADVRLSKVLNVIHEDPAREWDLNMMARLAGMSRARFAVRFREITGETPSDYLVSWRVMTAQRLLKRGLLLKHAAYDVGYGSASALTRAFVRKLGITPTEWLSSQKYDTDAGVSS